MARTQLFNRARPDITKLAILVTDGKATREAPATVHEANLTKTQNVEVFCVGISSDVCIACSVSLTHPLDCTVATRVKFCTFIVSGGLREGCLFVSSLSSCSATRSVPIFSRLQPRASLLSSLSAVYTALQGTVFSQSAAAAVAIAVSYLLITRQRTAVGNVNILHRLRGNQLVTWSACRRCWRS